MSAPPLPPTGSTSQAVSTALGAMHQRRVRRLLLVASTMVGVTSFGWGLIFASRGHLFTAVFDAFTCLVCLLTAAMTQRGQLRPASALLIATIYVRLCVNTVLLDIPTPAVPRSLTLFFLVLGAASCILLREERPTVRHGVPLLCMLTGVVLASSGFAVNTGLAAPEAVRAPGLWVNQGLAALMLYVVLQVLQTDVAERRGLEAELRHALVHGDLQLHYQPQVDTEGRIFGAEALLRWPHPKRGMVPPSEFIPLAEQCDLMVPLGDWVLRKACSQLAIWRQRPETAGLTLAVNVSAVQWAQADYVPRVLSRIYAAGIDPTRLKLELTESVVAGDLVELTEKMKALKAHGIGFSLDDFGTGYSSLSYLQRLPLDQLKIDQAFVRNMLGSASDAAIAQAVITLGKSLGLVVIAEGVETHAHRQLLAEMGCHAYQGYLFGRPLAMGDFEALLARGPLGTGAQQTRAFTDSREIAVVAPVS